MKQTTIENNQSQPESAKFKKTYDNSAGSVFAWVKITLGVILLAVGIYFFKITNHFTTGGVSGISIIVAKLFPKISTATSIIAINVLFLLIGFAVLGKETGVKTVYSTLLFSGLSWLLERLIPLDAPLTQEPLAELMVEVILAGVGTALLFCSNASSGGMDILALIIRKYTGIDAGKGLIFVNILIAASSFFLFNFQTGILSMLGLLGESLVIDYITDRWNVSKSLTIITNDPEPIVNYILNELHHSASTLDATGEFTKENKKMIVTVCHAKEYFRLKKKIAQLDPSAFLIVGSVNDVIGYGFHPPV